MTALWRRLAALTVLVLAGLVLAPVAEAQGRRLALVVGNAHYQSLPELKTPGEDASRMAEALRRLGFEVTLLSDVSDSMFKAMLGVVAEQSKGAEAVVFYYSGHALQIGGENYLLPVEARPDAADPAASAWSMSDVLRQLQSSGATTLVFLDACRTNPLGAAVGGDGLAAMDGETGTFVAFATRPGQVSYDKGAGPVSPFAAALLSHIETPGLGISDLMIRVRRDVEAETVGRQVPWDQSSLRESFQFRPLDASEPETPEASGEVDLFAGLEVVESDTVVAAASSASVPEAPPETLVRSAPEAEPSLPKVASGKGPAVAEAPEAQVPEAPEGTEVAVDPAPPETPAKPQLKKEALAALNHPGTPAAAVVPAGTTGVAPPQLSAVLPSGESRLDRRQVPVTLSAFSPRDRERLEPIPDPLAPGLEGQTDLVPAPSAEELPAAVQTELKRIGCYGGGVDGDWGGGSRAALKGYYAAKKQAPIEPLDPTEALWRTVSAEPEGVCKQPVAAAPKPKTVKKPAAAKPAADTGTKTTTKTTTKSTTQKPAAAAKPEKKGPTCKFMVVAIVCS